MSVTGCMFTHQILSVNYNHYIVDIVCTHDCIVLEVSFTTPEVQVSEDVSSGSVSVCFVADVASARAFTIQLGQRMTGDNPATCEYDYSYHISAR